MKRDRENGEMGHMGRFPSAVSYVLALGAGIPDHRPGNFRPVLGILCLALMSAIFIGFLGPATSGSDPLASATICREPSSDRGFSDTGR